MYINLLLFLVMLACVACLFNDGLWSNAIRLLNVILAALLAMNYYEPAATYLEDQMPTYSFVIDFLTLWALFFIFALILKLLTDQLSKVKVKFLKIVDQIGGLVFSLWIGWIMVCFTLTTLHTAPLARDLYPLGFATKSDEKMFMGLGPDRIWLGFTQKQSMGCYGHSPANTEKYVFDPDAKFLPTYAYRRAKCDAKNNKNSSIRLGTGENWWSD